VEDQDHQEVEAKPPKQRDIINQMLEGRPTLSRLTLEQQQAILGYGGTLGYAVAREIASWLLGADCINALKLIDRIEEIESHARTTQPEEVRPEAAAVQAETTHGISPEREQELREKYGSLVDDNPLCFLDDWQEAQD
jgi:hypothetical protein